MVVDKETIQQAKEKLGDQNAYLIAEIQGLKGFDTKNLKAFSPLRNETSPSYVYDRKRFKFKDFGSSYSADIIDALIEDGKTFLEACQYLFEKAGMNVSFGEMHVKTRKSYRYPKLEPENGREHVFEYLEKRHIPRRVTDYLDIREDASGNCVFNYYDQNDVLTMVKYRPSHTVDKDSGKPKTWCQKDADTTPLLFNMNRVSTGRPLLITEGEIDCASAIAAGYINTVSVPLGAGNLHWIESNWEWLEQFDDIIIWADNDEPGEKMRKECLSRLGTWRTKYIKTPDRYFNKQDNKYYALNDINDCLQAGGSEFVLDLISNAKDVPITSVVDYADIEEIDISELTGIRTGIRKLDKELIKLFHGTLTILTGRPGSGKTSLVDQIIALSCDSGDSVFLFSREMSEPMSTNWFNTIIAGRRNMITKTKINEDGEEIHFPVVPAETRRIMQEHYRNKLHIYKNSEPNDADSVLHSAEETVRKFGAKLVVLDNLMMIDLNNDDDNANSTQTKFINKLINFADKYNVAVILVAHPKKTPDRYSDIDMYDISGTSNIINLAHRSIGLRRVSDEEKENPRCKWKDYDVVITVMKDRIFGKSGFKMGIWYDTKSRRFYTNYDEYDRQFGWDNKIYYDRLEYVDRLAERPKFPDQ